MSEEVKKENWQRTNDIKSAQQHTLKHTYTCVYIHTHSYHTNVYAYQPRSVLLRVDSFRKVANDETLKWKQQQQWKRTYSSTWEREEEDDDDDDEILWVGLIENTMRNEFFGRSVGWSIYWYFTCMYLYTQLQ